MQAPITPKNEKARLDSLNKLNILDTLSEERFDRLTRMAKRMFDVPIAIVSIVDENRQWFKSCVGLDVSETPRDISFCGHTILGDDTFIIPDASKDKRFADNPLVTAAPNIRFYAGCPIRSPDKQKLGTVCIIDNKPRTLSDDDITSLKDIAFMVENEIAALELATVDELTQISNRRGFLLLADKSLSFCKRNQLTSTLAFLDINQFKQINDLHGHVAGDTALITFAELLRHHLRSYDICARLGGDEFVALFMNAQKDEAKMAIDKLKGVINQFNLNGGQPYNIHFSYGLVEFEPDRSQDITTLLTNSDIFMYRDKEQYRALVNSSESALAHYSTNIKTPDHSSLKQP